MLESTHPSINHNKPLSLEFLSFQEMETYNTAFSVKYTEDPTDSGYCFLQPEIYIQSREESFCHPKHVIFLVDISGSMRGEGLEAAKKCILSVFDELNPMDEITVTVFSTNIETLIDTTTKKDLANTFEETINALETKDSTALNDAILSVSDLSISDAGSTTVLLLSDGQDNASQFKGTVYEIIDQYNHNFDGTPPRIFPIGLGKSYDHNFLKHCSIASNFGMVDARDQSLLQQNIAHIVSGLACGVHMSLNLNDNTYPLGILNYDTKNTQEPLRILKKTLTDDSVIKLCINNAPFNYTLKTIIVEAGEDQRQIVSAYVMRQARKIYDDIQFSADEKIEFIERLKETYSLSLTDKEIKTVENLLCLIDKKDLDSRLLELLTKPDPRAPNMPSMRVFKEKYEINQQEIDNLKPRYEANQGYIEPRIEELNTQGSLARRETIARVPNSVLEVADTGHTNCFIGDMSSVRTVSLPFTSQLSRPPHVRMPELAFSNSHISLTREVDFSKLDLNKEIRSSYPGRETIMLNPSSEKLNELYNQISDQLSRAVKPLKEDLESVMNFVRNLLPRTDISNILDGRKNKTIENFLEQETGVCRHHSILMAYFIGRLSQNALLPKGKVTHYRAATNDLKSHSFIVFQIKGSLYLIDSALEMTLEIRDQETFQAAVKSYNEQGLHWVLRNLGADYDYAYPESEDELPLGLSAIARLQEKADKKPALQRKLQDENLICDVTGLIMSNPYKTDNGMSIEGVEQVFALAQFQTFREYEPDTEKKIRLWTIMEEEGCILPEEAVESESEKEELVRERENKIAEKVADYPVMSREPNDQKLETDEEDYTNNIIIESEDSDFIVSDPRLTEIKDSLQAIIENPQYALVHIKKMAKVLSEDEDNRDSISDVINHAMDSLKQDDTESGNDVNNAVAVVLHFATLCATEQKDGETEKAAFQRALIEQCQDAANFNTLSMLFAAIIQDNEEEIGLYNKLNFHENPNLDRFFIFNIKNTTTWRETIAVIREIAMEKLQDEVETLKKDLDSNAALEFLHTIKDDAIITEHKNNSLFQGAFGKTNARKTVDSMIKALEKEAGVTNNPESEGRETQKREMKNLFKASF